jgi:hypothetical protein
MKDFAWAQLNLFGPARRGKLCRGFHPATAGQNPGDGDEQRDRPANCGAVLKERPDAVDTT